MTALALARRKRSTALVLTAGVAAMVGLTFASVPLYRLFCQVTGFGGATVTATEAPAEALAATMVVRFDANLGRGMPWRFYPSLGDVTVHLGEQTEATYVVENPTGRTITGTATFNVTPEKAGPYFAKIACFCFQEQVLGPGERAVLPLTFYVDPAIADDPTMADVTAITLSYTFFESEPQ